MLKQEINGQIKYAQDIVDAFDKAAKGAVKNYQAENGTKKAADDGGDLQYSLNSFEDGKRFVDVQTDQHLFEGLSYKERGDKATSIIKERFKGKVIGIDNQVFVNGRTATEYGFPSKKLDDDLQEAKMRASTEIDNLIDAGTNFRTEPDGKDGHVHPNSVGDFRYFDTIFKVGVEYYSGVINIMPIQRGLLLKDITKIENITKDIRSSYGSNPKTTFLRDASMDIVLSEGENVNKKDLTDSDQRYLSERPDRMSDTEVLVRAAEAVQAKDAATSKLTAAQKDALSIMLKRAQKLYDEQQRKEKMVAEGCCKKLDISKSIVTRTRMSE